MYLYTQQSVKEVNKNINFFFKKHNKIRNKIKNLKKIYIYIFFVKTLAKLTVYLSVAISMLILTHVYNRVICLLHTVRHAVALT